MESWSIQMGFPPSDVGIDPLVVTGPKSLGWWP